ELHAAGSAAEDRANPDDHAATVPARASVVPPAMAPEESLTPTIDSGSVAIQAAAPASESPSPAPSAAAPGGTIDAHASPGFAKKTLIGPGFAAAIKEDEKREESQTQSSQPVEAHHEDAATDESEDVMSKKNRKKNRGGDREREV